MDRLAEIGECGVLAVSHYISLFPHELSGDCVPPAEQIGGPNMASHDSSLLDASWLP